jgi:hypothetical protein
MPQLVLLPFAQEENRSLSGQHWNGATQPVNGIIPQVEVSRPSYVFLPTTRAEQFGLEAATSKLLPTQLRKFIPTWIHLVPFRSKSDAIRVEAQKLLY